MSAETIQERLQLLGFYQGAIDGKIGPVTLQAISSALDSIVVKPAPAKLEPAHSKAAKPSGGRRINEIVVHCTATPEGREFSRDAIDKMHKARGFSGIGYHWLIHLDGTYEEGRPESQIGAHVAGHNSDTIGISYVGGVTAGNKAKDTRTAGQKAGMIQLLKEIIERHPEVKEIRGHRDYSPDKNHNGVVEPNEWIKQCPCFEAIPEYKALLG